ncbi:lytic transglycosylase domain-containing protein [Corynebacterium uberis]|uniref:lytic transglycosylase domain-containing protein n=1 Tax=Corynebacterium TaxID=1716 RepID=UPI001D0B5C7F|nr:MULTISPECIES: lytic murein transglycosylase [Corynebacterium]MCZ9308858.1 lytic murein transglycosylase [Corynebacterium sp. c6VSa_13]UDL74663.1 lytic murein transglycosylase [Corynebacterium uberis]UDL76503.1 lytic murein transglycosylase [Corynebacterium uberis]UDL78715.1 lytic murein transglycosylase [Corynebacterium uberis]UDL80994.1 lytic murein transglycosylase [Corynebacterium uberis]
MSFSEQASLPRRAAGCGCGVLVALFLVISLVGWAVTSLGGGNPVRRLEPIPDSVPPAAGDPVAPIDINAPGRTADQLVAWAQPLSQATGIPAPALRAYGNAALIAQQSWPQCHLAWTTLAGLAWVETKHGHYSGKLFEPSHIDEAGVVTPPIIGITLDGSPGVAEIPDTDGGALDGDPVYDRAVGPLQFIPESWERYGRDANGDGVADPHQIDDAALGAANLLCDGRDLSVPEEWVSAINSYNMSGQYLIKVRDAANSYALRQPAP